MRKDLCTRDFFLLLLYSLTPGIYKLFGSQLLMLLCIPIIIVLVFAKSTKENRLITSGWDYLFIYFVFYILFLNLIQLLNHKTNIVGLGMGLFLDCIPMFGFVYSRKLQFALFTRIVSCIAIVHLFIGILLYPPFGFSLLPQSISSILIEGVAFGRMSSVSGSLGFGNLMMLAIICAYYSNKRLLIFILIGLIFSAQRSAWLGSGFILFSLLFVFFKKGKIILLGKLVLALLVMISLLSIAADYFNLDLAFINERFEDLDNASSERNIQWTGGISNFLNTPIGTGVGQVGQVASRYETGEYNVIPDGDYFRMLSEFGVIAVLFLSFSIFLFFICFCNLKYIDKYGICLISLVGGVLIQMIGSNITEFYFNNFLIWTIFGYFFQYANKKTRIYI